MDNINSKCNDATKEYKEKYNKLLSLVNGYEIANDNQNESMKSLANIINNTKELISESEFEDLKKEQKNIMKDFAKLEEMKNDPYSEESIEFSNKLNQSNRFVSKEEEQKKNNLADKIKNEFSLQNINEIQINKSTNKVDVKDTQQQKQPTYNNIMPYNSKQQIMPNYYTNENKKYDVYSNFVPNQNQQMPTIQIVNVQEAPKPKIPKFEKKKSKFKEPNLKKNINNFLDKSFKLPNKDMVNKQHENYPDPQLFIKTKNKKRPKTKSAINHLNNFLTDYTENLRFKKPKSKQQLYKNSKKCKNSSFIKPMNNLSNNHNLFK